MIRKILSKIKYKIQRLYICRKKILLGNGSLIKHPFETYGSEYIILGNNVSIQPYSKLCCFNSYAGKEHQPSIRIGNNVFCNRFLTILSAGNLTIGNDTYFGSHVLISNENHGIDPSAGCYGLQELTVSDVHIGNNCWIGDHSIILPGVSIGDYAIVGAGSVVTKSLPSYTISVGNPAKIIKKWNAVSKTWEGA